MRKAERKRLRRWYFDRYVFWAVHRFFAKQFAADRKPPVPEPKTDLERFVYELLLSMQDTLWMKAYREALEWAYGISHLDLRVPMPAKGKVSSKSIQVKRIDL